MLANDGRKHDCFGTSKIRIGQLVFFGVLRPLSNPNADGTTSLYPPFPSQALRTSLLAWFRMVLELFRGCLRLDQVPAGYQVLA
jgi:hypothetical protein